MRLVVLFIIIGGLLAFAVIRCLLVCLCVVFIIVLLLVIISRLIFGNLNKCCVVLIFGFVIVISKFFGLFAVIIVWLSSVIVCWEIFFVVGCGVKMMLLFAVIRLMVLLIMVVVGLVEGVIEVIMF